MNTPAITISETKEPSQLPLVMLVDDSEIDNFVNNRILRRYEFTDRVLIYVSSPKAMEYLQNAEKDNKELPAVIFLDLNMPIMDGAMFLEKFEELPANIKDACKIVVLSSSGNPHDKSAMLSNKNVSSFFSKPLIKANLEHITIEIAKSKKQKTVTINGPKIAVDASSVMSNQKKTNKTSFLSFLGWPVPFNYDVSLK